MGTETGSEVVNSKSNEISDAKSEGARISDAILADIAMMAGTQLVKKIVEKTILNAPFAKDAAEKAIQSRPLPQRIIAKNSRKIAQASLAGAALVGGVLSLKMLYERGKKRGRRAPNNQDAPHD